MDILKQIADYHQVAIMLSPQSMSVNNFFDRIDPEKQFLLEQIKESENPEKTMKNFKDCLALINSQEHYNEWLESGFFTIIRENTNQDTREETCDMLARHFKIL